MKIDKKYAPWIIGITIVVVLAVVIGISVGTASKGGPREPRLLAYKRNQLRMEEARYNDCRMRDSSHCDLLWRSVLRLRSEVAVLEKQSSHYSYWWYPYYRGRWYNVSYPPYNPFYGWRWRRRHGRRQYENKIKSN